MVLRVVKHSGEGCRLGDDNCAVLHQYGDGLVLLIRACEPGQLYNMSLFNADPSIDIGPMSNREEEFTSKTDKLKETNVGEFSVITMRHLNEKHTYSLYSFPEDWTGIKHLSSKGSKQYQHIAEQLFCAYVLISDAMKDLAPTFTQLFLHVLLEQEYELTEQEKCNRALIVL